MVLVTYEPNNSGGYWWLRDKDWFALEEAGWKVAWHKDNWLGALAGGASKDFPTASEALFQLPDEDEVICAVRDAVKEFELVTGEDAMEEGCKCCGPPHSFKVGTWDREVIKAGKGIPHMGWCGESISEVLYGKKLTLREALERLKLAYERGERDG